MIYSVNLSELTIAGLNPAIAALFQQAEYSEKKSIKDIKIEPLEKSGRAIFKITAEM